MAEWVQSSHLCILKPMKTVLNVFYPYLRYVKQWSSAGFVAQSWFAQGICVTFGAHNFFECDNNSSFEKHIL